MATLIRFKWKVSPM